MTRVEWQQLAERWLVDAKRLLDDHRWSAAYYLSGYAVECGLKSCILKRLSATPEVIFESRYPTDRPARFFGETVDGIEAEAIYVYPSPLPVAVR